MVDKERKFRVLVQVGIIENLGYGSAVEATWHNEQVVVPLERIAALDANEMVDRAVRNVVRIAGQDETEMEPPEPVIMAMKHTAKKKS